MSTRNRLLPAVLRGLSVLAKGPVARHQTRRPPPEVKCMAARQDQTLQIALIVFAILLVIALGFVWYFHSTSQTQFARAEAAEKDRNDKQTQLNKFLDERN